MRLPCNIADIGEDQHRQVLVKEMRHSFGRRLALGKPYVGEWPERPTDIVAQGQ